PLVTQSGHSLPLPEHLLKPVRCLSSALRAAMRRRAFLSLLGGGAATLPVTARAQQPRKLPTIGFLGQSTPVAESSRLAAFLNRLRELGWVEGQSVAIEYAW